MKILKISRGDICIETNQGIVRVLGEALFPVEGEEFSEYVVYDNSMKIDNNSEHVTGDLKTRVMKFLEGELLNRKMKMIIE